MADTLIVLPTYNEIDNLATIIGRLRQSVAQADVLIVDDSSPDGTGILAEDLSAGDAAVSVLHRIAKDGLGRAYLAGFAQAFAGGYDYIIEIDADGSHDPAELPGMIELAERGADLVLGSRWVSGGSIRNWPWLRRALSLLWNTYARRMLRSGIQDLTSGFRVYRTEALMSLDLAAVPPQGYSFQIKLAVLLERSGHSIKEHPIAFVERATGRSKMRGAVAIDALLRVTWWGMMRR